jgi:hypothetical protein
VVRLGVKAMMDVFYVVLTLVFFAVSAAYVRGCDKL